MTATVAEPFRIRRELGRGGFATTYLADVVDPELRAEYGLAQVALKVPHGRREERVLKREVELNAGLHMRLQRLTSTHLVRYLGIEVFRGRIVMLMEYVVGGSLRDRLGPLGAQRRMPVAEACRVAIGMLRGLGLIHSERVFHRDIKPENILFGEDEPKIADLGIARLLDGDALAVTQAGTIPYMSPEILSATGASYSSDLWSTGVTLYEMTTGRLPFGDAQTSIRQFVELICAAEPRPADELCADVPRWLSTVIQQSLHKDPRQRFESAAEMIEALQAPVSASTWSQLGPDEPVAPLGPTLEPPPPEPRPAPVARLADPPVPPPRHPPPTGVTLASRPTWPLGLAVVAVIAAVIAFAAMVLALALSRSRREGAVDTRSLPGTYEVTGTFSQTARPYRGSLYIEARGEMYDLRWTTGDGKVESGSALLIGDVLAASAGKAPCGVAAYRVAAERLEGGWIVTGGPGRGKETWKRQGKDPGLSGTYSVEGKNPDGSGYSGSVIVEPQGDMLRVEWHAGGEQRGFGIRRGDVLVVGFGGSCQFAAYTVTGAGLDGVWAETATGHSGTEIATR